MSVLPGSSVHGDFGAEDGLPDPPALSRNARRTEELRQLRAKHTALLAAARKAEKALAEAMEQLESYGDYYEGLATKRWRSALGRLREHTK